MSLTINLDQATFEALQADADMHNLSCEELISVVIQNHYGCPENFEPDDAALFKAKVEEGLEAVRRGDFCTHEEVLKRMSERRARILARIADK